MRNDFLSPCFILSRQLAAAVLCLGSLASCASSTSVTEPGRTHYVQIQEHVSPQHLYVHVGYEVRWQNRRTAPVTIGLLSTLTADAVSCGKGFTRFGSLDDTATIPPDGYVSLCFARAGTIHYNVWLNPADPLRSMTPTAQILISARPA